MASWCVPSMKWCQAGDTLVSDPKAETGVKSRMRSTISGGRTVRGSAMVRSAAIRHYQPLALGRGRCSLSWCCNVQKAILLMHQDKQLSDEVIVEKSRLDHKEHHTDVEVAPTQP